MLEKFAVPPLESRGSRVDAWLASVSQLSRSRIKSLIESGRVSINGVVVPNPARLIKVGEEYCVEIPEVVETETLPQDIPLNILFEDELILVVNKPPGLVVHPAVGHPDGTLVNAVLNHCPKMLAISGEVRPGIVHRLDQDTSGAMVVAKTDAAMQSLTDSFQNGRVHKTYQTIVHGLPDPREGRIETLLGRHPAYRQKMAVVEHNGKTAVTTYKVVTEFEYECLLHVQIETGRTHQIRVHMKHIGCPVVGDAIYGKPKQDALMPVVPKRQMLHAWKLVLPHPATGEDMEFEAPPPKDFMAILKSLRG